MYIKICRKQCTDTSDPGHFRPKTVRHYVFGTEMSYFFCRCQSVFGTLRHQCRTVSTFYEGAEVSSGHFGTSAEVSVSDRYGGAFMFLYHFHHLTSHLHHPSWSSDCFLRHFCIYEIIPNIEIWLINLTHNSYQSYFTFPRASFNKLLILSCPRHLGGGIKRWCCMTYVCLSRTCGLSRALQLFR